MGRGKDKRTKENLSKFHNQLERFNIHHKLAFVKIGDIFLNLIISSSGVLYSIDNENKKIVIIDPYMEKDGHLRVGISVNGKKIKVYIHSLVAKAFIPNPENKPEVHHKDGDELNNDVTNLMWVTRKEHAKLTKELNQYCDGLKGSNNPSSSYTDEQIEKVCMLLESNEMYLDEICKECGITYDVIQHLLHRENYWGYIRNKYDITKFNKYRRLVYDETDKQKFVKLLENNPSLSLKSISKILNINYSAIKRWNNEYKHNKSEVQRLSKA